jgi:hypothetical protein
LKKQKSRDKEVKKIMKRNILYLIWLFICAASFAGAQTKVVPILEMKVGGLIGGVKNGKFLDAKTTAAALKGGETYALYTLMGKEEGEIVGTKPKNDQDVCTDFYYVEIEPKAETGIALGDGYRWNPVPRIPKALSLTDKTYVKIAADYLKLKGIAKPVVKLTQLYRVDLEGDGQEEIIMSATHYSGDNAAAAAKNDYSFTIVRKIVAGKVKNILLGGDFITKGFDFGAPNTYEVSAIADLNGDGKMEIIHYGAYYEGSGTAVYQILNGKEVEIKVLGAGCGV